jgi:LmbE family N-acetylglucosaminyl deacetylase
VRRIYNILSPHLDDAALSCALLLAANPGSCITTVFASGPASVRPLPPWDDAARYFTDGADVMKVRRREDVAGAALVGASTVHLPYWDRQYRSELYGYHGPQGDDLAQVIAQDILRRVAEPARCSWVIPVGLGHPDHRMVAEVGLRLAEAGLAGRIYAYEELPYAAENGAELADRKACLRQRGFALERSDTVDIGTDRRLKSAVISCHASQRRSLRRRARAASRTPERIWVLVQR